MKLLETVSGNVVSRTPFKTVRPSTFDVFFSGSGMFEERIAAARVLGEALSLGALYNGDTLSSRFACVCACVRLCVCVVVFGHSLGEPFGRFGVSPDGGNKPSVL